MDILRLLYEAKPDAPLEDAAYRAALEQTCRTERELLEAFPEARAHLSAFQSAQFELFSHTAYHEFAEGFAMGMRLAVEVLREK